MALVVVCSKCEDEMWGRTGKLEVRLEDREPGLVEGIAEVFEADREVSGMERMERGTFQDLADHKMDKWLEKLEAGLKEKDMKVVKWMVDKEGQLKELCWKVE